MQKKESKKTDSKQKLHKRNKNNVRYDFKELVANDEALKPHVVLNKHNSESINFADAIAVKELNKAILKTHYNISYWNIPANYLCPPIPGRADYIHYMADLLATSNYGKIPIGAKVKGLDIGIGANCIYPIIGVSEYQWSFIGSDIDAIAIDSAKQITDSNSLLKKNVECRLQAKTDDVLYGILRKDEKVDFTICNPPFHASAEEAQKGSLRKQNNLTKKRNTKVELNFGGQSNELWCEGGEKRFVRNMIKESKKFATNCYWFSTLISKQTHLKAVYEQLKEAGATRVETIAMSTGNKSTRIVAWTFLDKVQQKAWRDQRWS